jgi:murein DD-endopeptidase MepM/ murein hydrolase activator NlpD
MIAYRAQGGDTLEILGKRFGVNASEIISGDKLNLPAPGVLLQPGLLLLVPDRLPDAVSPGAQLIPDSEIVYSPSTIGFNVDDYVNAHGGYLSTYREYLMHPPGWVTGSQTVERMTLNNSLNPRMMLALIEYQSHWVLGQPTNLAQQDYPLGYVGSYGFYYKGLGRQLMWATGKLSEGYYQWRTGRLSELTFGDGSKLRLNPRLNAGTAALQYFFSLTRDRAGWEQAVAETGFAALYRRMYGDPWERAKAVEPLIPAGLTQPTLTLPFERGQLWSFTNGPHTAWQEPDGKVILEGGALAALDFAPAAEKSGCILSNRWVLAPAGGIVVRTDEGEVILDLDGDGQEQTGWDILFMHIAQKDSAKLGDVLKAGDLIGHPSCEGGVSYGTHLHIARKYNGEWILAAGPIPFDLDGWIAHGGDVPGQGTLVRDGQIVKANSNGPFETRITRDK